MLKELYLLESFYGQAGYTAFLSDLSNKFGLTKVKTALERGDMLAKPVHVGPDQGRYLISLTEQGRNKAMVLDANQNA